MQDAPRCGGQLAHVSEMPQDATASWPLDVQDTPGNLAEIHCIERKFLAASCAFSADLAVSCSIVPFVFPQAVQGEKKIKNTRKLGVFKLRFLRHLPVSCAT